MQALAPQAAATGPFLAVTPATGSVRKSSAKSAALSVKATAPAAARFPKLLEGLVEAGDQGTAEPLHKEEVRHAAFWLSADLLYGQGLGQAKLATALPLPTAVDATQHGELASLAAAGNPAGADAPAVAATSASNATVPAMASTLAAAPAFTGTTGNGAAQGGSSAGLAPQLPASAAPDVPLVPAGRTPDGVDKPAPVAPAVPSATWHIPAAASAPEPDSHPAGDVPQPGANLAKAPAPAADTAEWTSSADTQPPTTTAPPQAVPTTAGVPAKAPVSEEPRMTPEPARPGAAAMAGVASARDQAVAPEAMPGASQTRLAARPDTSRPKSPQNPSVPAQPDAGPTKQAVENHPAMADPAIPASIDVNAGAAPVGTLAPVLGQGETGTARPVTVLDVGAPALSGSPALVTPQADPARRVSSPTAARATGPQPSPDSNAGNPRGQPLNLAFAATLKPVGAVAEGTLVAVPHVDPQETPRTEPVASRLPATFPEKPGTAATPPPAAEADNAMRPAEGSSRPAQEKQPDGEPPRWRKQQENSATESAVAPASPSLAGPQSTLYARTTGEAQPAERPAEAEQPAQTARPQPDPVAEPVKTAAAHDIKLQVGGEGDRRVEVRVTERGGDVQVSVRTPDTRLAGELREDLPALAARLEQSGYRAETWHPATGERQPLSDPRTLSAAQDAQSQSQQNGGEQQRDPQQQKQKEPENPEHPSQGKQPGKDFEWLLSSLQ